MTEFIVALYIITYDLRAAHRHDYHPLYNALNQAGCAHLQDSVWLGNLTHTVGEARQLIKSHMHADDTLCVIELKAGSEWATSNARQTGNDWLTANLRRY